MRNKAQASTPLTTHRFTLKLLVMKKTHSNGYSLREKPNLHSEAVLLLQPGAETQRGSKVKQGPPSYWSETKIVYPPVSACIEVISEGLASWKLVAKGQDYNVSRKKKTLASSSLVQHPVAVPCWWCCMEADAHICFSTSCWTRLRLRALWAEYLIIYVVVGGGTERSYSAFTWVSTALLSVT